LKEQIFNTDNYGGMAQLGIQNR